MGSFLYLGIHVDHFEAAAKGVEQLFVDNTILVWFSEKCFNAVLASNN